MNADPEVAAPLMELVHLVEVAMRMRVTPDTIFSLFNLDETGTTLFLYLSAGGFDESGGADEGNDLEHFAMDVVTRLVVARFDEWKTKGLAEGIRDRKGLFLEPVTARTMCDGLDWSESRYVRYAMTEP